MCWLINCPQQHQCKYRPTKTPLRSWLLCIEHDVPTVCQSTCKASLNFTSRCEINVLLVVHSILWRQERQQQQTGNEERVSEGKMIKIKEAETDVRGKNWDQTDNDSETVVENTEEKTTVEVRRSTKRHFLQEGRRKMSKWGVHNCTRGVSCNETNSNWIDQLWCESTSNFYQVSKSFIFYFTKGLRKRHDLQRLPWSVWRKLDECRMWHWFFLNSPTQQLIVRHETNGIGELSSGFLPTQGTCIAHEEHLVLPISCYLFQSVHSNWTSILVRHSTMTRLLCIESNSYKRCVLILWNTLVLQPNWMQLKVSLKCYLCNA